MFNKKELAIIGTKLIRLESNLQAEKDNNAIKNNEFNERLKVIEEHLDEYLAYRTKKDSEEPFLEVISESFSETNGIELKLDWNEAMINFLKRNGYQGQDDDDIIEKYILDLLTSAKNNKSLI